MGKIFDADFINGLWIGITIQPAPPSSWFPGLISSKFIQLGFNDENKAFDFISFDSALLGMLAISHGKPREGMGAYDGIRQLRRNVYVADPDNYRRCRHLFYLQSGKKDWGPCRSDTRKPCGNFEKKVCQR